MYRLSEIGRVLPGKFLKSGKRLVIQIELNITERYYF
jgi:hypothetical protein